MDEQVTRGTPRYVDGAAGGALGVVTLIPEARAAVNAVQPVAVVAVLGDTVTRLTVERGRDGWLRPLAVAAALVPVLALILARRAGARR